MHLIKSICHFLFQRRFCQQRNYKRRREDDDDGKKFTTLFILLVQQDILLKYFLSSIYKVFKSFPLRSTHSSYLLRFNFFLEQLYPHLALWDSFLFAKVNVNNGQNCLLKANLQLPQQFLSCVSLQIRMAKMPLSINFPNASYPLLQHILFHWQR